MNNLHYIQLQILRELLFKKHATFTELNRDENISNDHFTYHIKQLLGEGLIAKEDKQYLLTDKGKEFAGRLDVETATVIPQAKISVAVTALREQNGVSEVLVMERTREPSMGKIAWIDKKQRKGELLQQTAARALSEETGLVAKHYNFNGVTHVIRRDIDLEIDIVSIHFVVKEIHGEIINNELFGKAKWISTEQFFKIDPDHKLVGMDERLDSALNEAVVYQEIENEKIVSNYRV